MSDNLKFSIHDPLHPLDTETQTYGCRANNPNICANGGLKTCSFVTKKLCTSPSRAWKKIYLEKKAKEEVQ